MMVREGKVPAAYKARSRQVAPPRIYEPYTFPAPVRGWVANESLAMAQPGAALVLENYFPTQQGAKLRGGATLKATVGDGVISSLLSYASGATKKLFAVAAGKIFDITTPADPEVAPTPDVSGLAGDFFSSVMFSTVADDYMYAVNGEDEARLYDGASWLAINASSTPAITGVTTSTLSQVWSYRNRLFFVQGGTKDAWYLPVDSIGGSATKVSMAGVFRRGGALLMGATWSLDAGDGLDDKCVFISDQGEAAIYEGSNPGDANDWRLVGRYDISAPLGKNATMQAGGDLLIATQSGLIPLSEAIKKDVAALSLAAVSRNIEPEWKRDALSRSARPWHVAKWPEKNMGIIAVPGNIQIIEEEGGEDSDWGSGDWSEFIWGVATSETLAVTDPYCYIVNLETGAWAKYTGWDTQCLVYHDGQVYFGTATGVVLQAESGASDNGIPYTCRSASMFEGLGMPGVSKDILMARPTYRYSVDFRPKTTVAVNYSITWDAPPEAAPAVEAAAVWDSSTWDNAVWDASSDEQVLANWVSIGRTGYAISVQTQVTCGGTVTPDAELVAIDVTYQTGNMVN